MAITPVHHLPWKPCELELHGIPMSQLQLKGCNYMAATRKRAAKKVGGNKFPPPGWSKPRSSCPDGKWQFLRGNAPSPFTLAGVTNPDHSTRMVWTFPGSLLVHPSHFWSGVGLLARCGHFYRPSQPLWSQPTMPFIFKDLARQGSRSSQLFLKTNTCVGLDHVPGENRVNSSTLTWFHSWSILFSSVSDCSRKEKRQNVFGWCGMWDCF